MALYKKIIPEIYVDSVKDIPYKSLKAQGIKALLFDLDNTLIDYEQTKLDSNTSNFLIELEKDFLVIIISNSYEKRVYGAVGNQFSHISFAKKPLKFGFKKALKKLMLVPKEVAIIGDQLMTDIFGGNRMGFYPILVNPIKQKTDKLPTRINRIIEKFFIRKVKRNDPKKYDEVLKKYAEKY